MAGHSTSNFGGSGVTGVLRGLLGGGLVNSGLTAIQNLITGLFSQHPPSGSIAPPAMRFAGSRALGK